MILNKRLQWSNELKHGKRFDKNVDKKSSIVSDFRYIVDLDWNDDCLNFYNNKRPIKTASDVQARNKIYKSSVDSWKHYEKYLSKYFTKLKVN